MPRKKNPLDLTSCLRNVQWQARALLSKHRIDIRNKETQLKRLKAQESGLARMVGGAGPSRRVAQPRSRRGARVNWRDVQKRLPRQFKASDVRTVRGLKNKRSSEIFAAITRWIEGGGVKRKSRGVYERV